MSQSEQSPSDKVVRLTREQIEAWRKWLLWKLDDLHDDDRAEQMPEAQALCDMALASLSAASTHVNYPWLIERTVDGKIQYLSDYSGPTWEPIFTTDPWLAAQFVSEQGARDQITAIGILQSWTALSKTLRAVNHAFERSATSSERSTIQAGWKPMPKEPDDEPDEEPDRPGASNEQPTSAAAGSTKAAEGEDSHREGLATASHATTPEPLKVYSTDGCQKHMGQSWYMKAFTTYAAPAVKVCPLCEQESTPLSGSSATRGRDGN